MQLIAGVACLVVGLFLALLIGTEPVIYPIGGTGVKVYATYAFGLAGGLLVVGSWWRRGQPG